MQKNILASLGSYPQPFHASKQQCATCDWREAMTWAPPLILARLCQRRWDTSRLGCRPGCEAHQPLVPPYFCSDIVYGGVLKWGYPQIIHVSDVFFLLNHLFWGSPISGTPHIHGLWPATHVMKSPWSSHQRPMQALAQRGKPRVGFLWGFGRLHDVPKRPVRPLQVGTLRRWSEIALTSPLSLWIP